ncbi:MAG: flagellar basal body L-ring protein FlgH [Deltaproteobacteria bacterium]|nr:flagellar basal body L-ring protein FlgH [Deltaproteobacteria bacterium]
MRRLGVVTLFVLAPVLASCGGHIAPYQHKKRRFQPDDYPATPQASSASIYREGELGLFEDDRATRVGDIVVIRIDEFESATRDASTKMDRKSSTAAGIQNSFGLLSSLPQGVSPGALLGATSQNSFDSQGKIERGGRLQATLPVRVRRLLPNGDLYVEGQKVILVNEEEHHLYISGIVRARDIDSDNVVLSSRVAEAEIEYFGKGTMSDTQRQGWLSRLFNKIWPF